VATMKVRTTPQIQDERATGSASASFWRWTGVFGLAVVALTWAQFPLWTVGTQPPAYNGTAFAKHLFDIKTVALTRILMDLGIYGSPASSFAVRSWAASITAMNGPRDRRAFCRPTPDLLLEGRPRPRQPYYREADGGIETTLHIAEPLRACNFHLYRLGSRSVRTDERLFG
jgi:hypothetical protein